MLQFSRPIATLAGIFKMKRTKHIGSRSAAGCLRRDEVMGFAFKWGWAALVVMACDHKRQSGEESLPESRVSVVLPGWIGWCLWWTARHCSYPLAPLISFWGFQLSTRFHGLYPNPYSNAVLCSIFATVFEICCWLFFTITLLTLWGPPPSFQINHTESYSSLGMSSLSLAYF